MSLKERSLLMLPPEGQRLPGHMLMVPLAHAGCEVEALRVRAPPPPSPAARRRPPRQPPRGRAAVANAKRHAHALAVNADPPCSPQHIIALHSTVRQLARLAHINNSQLFLPLSML